MGFRVQGSYVPGIGLWVPFCGKNLEAFGVLGAHRYYLLSSVTQGYPGSLSLSRLYRDNLVIHGYISRSLWGLRCSVWEVWEFMIGF